MRSITGGVTFGEKRQKYSVEGLEVEVPVQ